MVELSELTVKCRVDLFSDLFAQLSDTGLNELQSALETEIFRRGFLQKF